MFRQNPSIKVNEINVLLACEESQRTCIEFRKLGFTAFSCDIQECSGGHPEWHINQDALSIINGNCGFTTQDGNYDHFLCGTWDLIIAHPPYTYLTVAGNRFFNIERYGDSARERWRNRFEAADFFMKFVIANCRYIAIENPMGWMNTHFKKPDQTIHPYMFAPSIDSDEYVTKRTCLWLKNLPLLQPTNDFPMPDLSKRKWGNGKNKCWTEMQGKNRAEIRSKTFPGISKAFAEQWGEFVWKEINKNEN